MKNLGVVKEQSKVAQTFSAEQVLLPIPEVSLGTARRFYNKAEAWLSSHC
jgi:hypothetical protein